MAKYWGVGTWIVKLDIKKAFDSVSQSSMAKLIAEKVGVKQDNTIDRTGPPVCSICSSCLPGG